MKYQIESGGTPLTISLDKTCIQLGPHTIDYVDVVKLRPVDHNVYIDTISGTIEIAMLGHSFDGFWEELTGLYGNRSLEALYTKAPATMTCGGEYQIGNESGYAIVMLFPDSVCILPPTMTARRIALAFAETVTIEGYTIHIAMDSGEKYSVGKMGYDTMPFFERLQNYRNDIIYSRQVKLDALSPSEPFQKCGLFRTDSDEHWEAAFGNGICALELFSEENAATYIYKFSCNVDKFFRILTHSLEAMGINREIIFIDDEKLCENSLYRMAIERTPAVRELRSYFSERLIHNQNWENKLKNLFKNDIPQL